VRRPPINRGIYDGAVSGADPIDMRPRASPPCLRFEKASLVAKLRAARERKVAAGGRGGGRFPYAQKVAEVVALVRELHGQRQSLRQMSKTLAGRPMACQAP
jgi:hypothetical protein